MVDIMDKLQALTDLGKPMDEKQKLINVNEVFYIWDVLMAKSDILETLHIFDDFIEDKDLKFVAGRLVKGLLTGINDMEELMKEYDIPFPARPPVSSNSTSTFESFTDRQAFADVLEGIQAFFPLLSNGFMNSTTPKVRKAFKNHLLLTMELQELIVEYGKLKGFLEQPPVYRV